MRDEDRVVYSTIAAAAATAADTSGSPADVPALPGLDAAKRSAQSQRLAAVMVNKHG